MSFVKSFHPFFCVENFKMLFLSKPDTFDDVSIPNINFCTLLCLNFPFFLLTILLHLASSCVLSYICTSISTHLSTLDIEAIKRSLVHCANTIVPLSLVLVGVGNGDMTNMDLLDADRQTLSYRGVQAKRDIVQFVGKLKFHHTLIEKVLFFTI